MTFDSTPMSQARGVEHLVTYANGDQGRAVWHGLGDLPIKSVDEHGIAHDHDKDGLEFSQNGTVNEVYDIAGYADRCNSYQCIARRRRDGSPAGPFVDLENRMFAGDGNWQECVVTFVDSPTAREGVAS